MLNFYLDKFLTSLITPNILVIFNFLIYNHMICK